jgi:hypothetical protein
MQLRPGSTTNATSSFLESLLAQSTALPDVFRAKYIAVCEYLEVVAD